MPFKILLKVGDLFHKSNRIKFCDSYMNKKSRCSYISNYEILKLEQIGCH